MWLKFINIIAALKFEHRWSHVGPQTNFCLQVK